MPAKMSKSTPHRQFLHDLPKCEHHLHIEGTLSPSLLFTLAKANNISLPSDDPSFASLEALCARYERFTSLTDFLHYYYIAMSALITSSDYEYLAYEYFTRAHADNVHHTELSFDPQAHTSRGIAYTTVVSGLAAAQKRAEADFGITSKLILCFHRNAPVPGATALYQDAVSLGHFSDGTVSGIGLDSAEVGFPPELFQDIYTSAASSQIHRTAHAGEEGDTTYISRALDLCLVERIDHGIRLVEDEALLQRVARDKVLLTMCPLSNVRLRCVTKVAELPVRKFLDEGVKFSINSDDPAYFGGYLLDNYYAVQDAFKLSFEEWNLIARTGIEGSWCDEERKKALLGKVEEWAKKYKDLV